MLITLASHLARLLLLLPICLALTGPARAATVQVLHFKGTFAAAARLGSDPFFQSLAGGSFQGTYSVPVGSFPGIPGTSFALPDFHVDVLTPGGQRAVAFQPGRDTGGFFFDFFGPGTGDGFVFNGEGLQFQIGVVSGFTGMSPILSDALFGVAGGPVGGIQIASGAASIPVPVPAAMLGGALVLMFALGRRQARRGALLHRADARPALRGRNRPNGTFYPSCALQ